MSEQPNEQTDSAADQVEAADNEAPTQQDGADGSTDATSADSADGGDTETTTDEDGDTQQQ